MNQVINNQTVYHQLQLVIVLVISFFMLSSVSVKGETFRYIEATESAVIYDNESGSLEPVGELVKGESYPIKKTLENWYQLQFGEGVTYVHKRDVKRIDGDIGTDAPTNKRAITTNQRTTVYDNSTGTLVPFATLNENVALTANRSYGNWWEVTIFNRTGYVKKTEVTASFTLQDRYFTVTGDEAVIYDNRTGALTAVGTLIKGETYRRISDYGNWHQIDLGDFYGYVHKRHTDIGQEGLEANFKPATSPAIRTFTVIDSAIVYDNTGDKLEPFVHLKSGFPGVVLADYGNWWRVNISGREGYLKKSAVTIDFSDSDRAFKTTETTPIYKLEGQHMRPVGELAREMSFYRIDGTKLYHQVKIGNENFWVRRQKTTPVSEAGRLTAPSDVNLGSLTPETDVAVYDNDSGGLVQIATIQAGTTLTIKEDYGNWLGIDVSGRTGYVLKREVNYQLQTAKDIVKPKQVYTYEDMIRDLDSLKNQYPNLLSLETIGSSVEGRKIQAVKLGHGDTDIFINASHHAREWLTTNVLMEMIDTYAYHYTKGHSYEGYDLTTLFKDVSLYFVPMVNPDGVTLVQLGKDSPVLGNSQSMSFDRWKANIRGVDLNQQYPYHWYDAVFKETVPHYENYPGKKPLSEPESQAIYQFTKQHDFKAALSYHSSGEVLYTRYLNPNVKPLAETIGKLTGYRPINLGTSLFSARGYTDWFIQTMKQPALTIEIAPSVGPRPVPLSYWDSIWQKNKTVPLKTAVHVLAND